MNHANAIRLKPGRFESDLCITPAGRPIGTMLPGELYMPADIPRQEVEGVERVALIVWVNADEVTRCGSADE